MKCPECDFPHVTEPRKEGLSAGTFCPQCGFEIFFSLKPDVAREYKALLQDLIRATNGANINPRFPIGAGMAAQIQAVAERARILIEGR